MKEISCQKSRVRLPLTRDRKWSTYDVTVLKLSNIPGKYARMGSLKQGGRARTDFSLAWLEAVCHCSGSGHGPTRN
jgi:hypothetical protein